MGSLRFSGIRFTAYTMNHEPRHVHGFYAEIEVARKQNRRHQTWQCKPIRHTTYPDHKVTTTDTDIDAALKSAKLHDDHEPLAKYMEHIPDLNLLIVALTNQRRLVLPLEDLQGLEKATHTQLQHCELLGRGTGISFPDLDVGLYVPALIEGVYGNCRWMASLGRKGGAARTPAKRLASRANGSKGGRPRKAMA